MSRRTNRLAARARHLDARPRPELERLEDRCLLNADPLTVVAGHAADRILVGYDDGSSAVFEVGDGTTATAALDAYKAQAGVAYAELDYTVSIALTPNDTSYGQLYGLNNTGQTIQGQVGTIDADIDAPEAWDQTTGSVKVVVGVIDTGIDYRHPDLYLNIWINQDEIPTAVRANLTDVDSDGVITFYDLNNAVNQGAGKITDRNANGRIDGGDLLFTTANGGWADGVDQDPFSTRGINYSYIDDLVGWNFVANTNNPLDDNGHGTHVAGTIGAIGNNGVGVAGVNWRSSLAALKFLGASGSGSLSGAVLSVDYAVGNGMDLTNNSWGGGGYSTTLYNAINNARLADQLFVAAAGNAGTNIDASPSYPASYNLANVVAVAATDNRDNLAGFSNYGATTVDIAAPGVNILSTTPNGGYAYFSGTSMASPHVAGAAALILAKDPTLTYAQVVSRLTGAGNFDPPNASLSGKVATGRLNVHKALPGDSPPSFDSGPRVVAAAILGSTTSVSGIRLTFSEAVNASTFNTSDLTAFTGFTPTNLAVSQVNATTFDVTFTAVTTAGSYSFRVGPNLTDTATPGNLMNQDNDTVNGEANDYATVQFNVSSAPATLRFTNDTDYAIRDYTTTTSPISVTQTGTITDVNVEVTLTHTYVGDLRLRLIAPDGTIRTLFYYHGGGGDNMTATVFDDEAGTSITAGAAPYAGSFRPYNALSPLDGKSITGTWRLQVYDGAGADIGTLRSWSIIFTTSGGGAGGQSIGESSPADEPLAGPDLGRLADPVVETPALATPILAPVVGEVLVAPVVERALPTFTATVTPSLGDDAGLAIGLLAGAVREERVATAEEPAFEPTAPTDELFAGPVFLAEPVPLDFGTDTAETRAEASDECFAPDLVEEVAI